MQYRSVITIDAIGTIYLMHFASPIMFEDQACDHDRSQPVIHTNYFSKDENPTQPTTLWRVGTGGQELFLWS